MRGFVGNIEDLTLANENFRRVLYTGKNVQLVLMSLKAGEEIGEEVHSLDQFIRVEAGEGTAVLDGTEHVVRDGIALVIPAGMHHNFINTSITPMKLYTLYAPPEHREGIVHATKENASSDSEHFDGATTE